ncbi:FMN-binding protein [Nucisporomicrobium flavum]|jgi:uncharacterized protein with FMN-binding domain|uniref:FMN-binding protein n=1 Tax=Nucisporomicrobium flavum TaxID=2785915 RepID=UPI0018F7126E|nr:FMN-binding protein [Nucisporomicrobium flavum]
MRRISMWLFSTVVAVVLLFSYRTSTNATTEAPATAAASTAGGSGSTSGGKTYTGSVASTRWGDVQVAITVADGTITEVTVPVHPSENGKDREINAYALPVLKQETLAAQSADIDAVSGATVTSDGYVESLQSALDAAHLS